MQSPRRTRLRPRWYSPVCAVGAVEVAVPGSALEQAVLSVLVPVLATIVGGLVAVVRPPTPRVRSYVQHFAAGVVFAAVAVELLPQLVHGKSYVAVAVGFALGTALLLVVRSVLEPGEVAGGESESPRSLVAAVGVDIFIDGLLVGLALAVGGKTGVLVVLALTLEVLFVGLAVAASLTGARSRTLLTVAALALALAVGALVGTTVFSHLAGAALTASFAFGSAALLYLVTEELLVEAHEVPETAVTTAMFFVGFLLLLLIDMASG